MDAWVLRRAALSPRSVLSAPLPLPPVRQLVASDCALLVALAADDAAPVQRTLEAAGARVLHSEADVLVDAAVTLVVVGTTAAVDAATHRHPHAQVVPPAWVLATIQTNVRKEQDSGAHGSSADVDGSNGQQSAEPVRKKPRVDADIWASSTCKGDVAGDSRCADGGGGADGAVRSAVHSVDIGAPLLTRNWESVASGALHFLDARCEITASTTTPITKLAAFDLDGTLIVTKTGKRFAQHADDWKLLDTTRVPATLLRLAREGFTLAILSNQNGVAKGKTTASAVQIKMVAIVRRLNIPMLVLFATQDDEMRKPRTGAWQWLLQRLAVQDLDTAASLYCGDAAGRPKITGRNKDFAATDYKFALNAGLHFFTPEALFLQSTQRIHTRPDMWEIGFDPRGLLVGGARDRLDPPTTAMVRETQEIVLLVGPPASGKSHFATKFTGYRVVCQDDLKTVVKCLAVSTQALQAGTSVVVDCTNRDPRNRKDWIALAQTQGVAVRCFYMDVAKPLCMHLNTFRKLTTAKDIPDIAIHTFYKNYVPPQKEEGFEAVVKVGFRVDADALSPAHRQLLLSFL